MLKESNNRHITNIKKNIYIKWDKQNVIKNTILKLPNKKKIYSSKFNTYCGSTINNYEKLPNYISQNITLQNPN